MISCFHKLCRFKCKLRHYSGVQKLPDGGASITTRIAALDQEIQALEVGLGRKCSKCPSTHSKPSILELKSII